MTLEDIETANQKKSEIRAQDYQNHHVFDEIEYMRGFYDSVSFSCFNYIPTGTHGIVNYATYVYLALRGTLESIGLTLKNGLITDAFALLRKYYDDVLAEIYIDITRKDKYDWEKSFIVEDVDKWLRDTLWMPSMKGMKKALKESPSTKDLYPFFGWDSYLKKNRAILDAYVHGSRYRGMLLNCPTIALGYRKKHLDGVSTVLKQVFTLHLAFIFYLNSEYLMSSYYMDCLDCGETPPEGCETWISNYAQEAFDKYIMPNPKLAEFIREHCCLDIT